MMQTLMPTFWMRRSRDCLLLGILLYPVTAQAAPAPLFDAILPEIQQQRPSELQVRLPSYLPEPQAPLYPSVEVSDTGLAVYLSPDPNCDRSLQPDCMTVGGAAIMFPDAFADWQQRHQDDLTPVGLANNITGRYLSVNFGEGELHYVAWQQDQTGYILGAAADGISLDEFLRVANSMIEAEPIE
jgi:hypothetical protein